jgi:hypothetical protein
MAERPMAEQIAQLLRQLNPNHFLVEVPEDGEWPKGHASIGLGWIDEVIKRFLPQLRLVDPLFVAATIGAFGDEFDWWRAARALGQRTGFHIAWVHTRDMEGVCLNLTARDKYRNWRGTILDGDRVGLLLASFEFTSHVAGTQYRLLFDNAMSPREALVTCFANPDTKAVPAITEADLALIDKGRKLVAECTAVLFDMRLSEGAVSQEASELISSSAPATSNRRSYCQSAVIHFTLSHEFGHYLSLSEADNVLCMSTAELVSEFQRASNLSLPDDTVEEIFCDFIGLDNCLAQMLRFDVPPTYTMVGTLWIIHYASGRLRQSQHPDAQRALQQLEVRRMAICWYWANQCDGRARMFVNVLCRRIDDYLSELSELSARLCTPSAQV